MNKSAGQVGEQKKPVTQRQRLQAKASVGSLRQPNVKASHNEKAVKTKLVHPTKTPAAKQGALGSDTHRYITQADVADAHFISFDGHGSTI
jgi:hypothetical protein